jgi:hypothetical protein
MPAAPKKSRKRRLIVLSSAAVVAAIVLIGPSRHSGTPQASSTSASPAPPANTGPLTGTFTVHMDQAYLGRRRPRYGCRSEAVDRGVAIPFGLQRQ